MILKFPLSLWLCRLFKASCEMKKDGWHTLKLPVFVLAIHKTDAFLVVWCTTSLTTKPVNLLLKLSKMKCHISSSPSLSRVILGIFIWPVMQWSIQRSIMHTGTVQCASDKTQISQKLLFKHRRKERIFGSRHNYVASTDKLSAWANNWHSNYCKHKCE